MTEAEKARLRAELRRRKSAQGGVSTNSQAVDEFQAKGEALLQGAGRGGTFGLVDDMAGVNTAIKGALTGNFNIADNFRHGRDTIRTAQQQAREAEPIAFQGGEFLGGAAASSASLPAASGKTLLGTMGRGFGLGGLEGAVYGSAGNDGRDDLLGNTARSAIAGALIGGAAPAVVAGAQGAWRAAKDPVTGVMDTVLNRANQGKANRAIAGTVRSSGRNLDDIGIAVSRAAREGQPDYRVMDALGVSGRRQASSMARSGGASADDLAEFLEARQAGASDRVRDFTDDAFGMEGRTRQAWENTVRENRKAVADTLYDQAAKDAKPVDVRATVARLDDTISQMENSGIKPPAVVKEYKRLRAKLAGQTAEGDPTTLSDYNSVLALWREVRDQVDKAYKAGDGHIGEALKPIRDSLQSALEESSDLYRFATDNYRAGSGVIEAFDTGANAAKRGRAADNIGAFEGLTEQQKRAARIGYGDTVSEALERNKAEAANAAREYRSPKRQAESQAMATDPALLQRRIDREMDMNATYQRAVGGSRTADNLQDIESGSEAASGMLGAARSAANFQFGDTVARLAAMLGPIAKGQNEATRQLIARALLSNNPQAAIAPALRQDMRNQSGRRLIEAILRSAGRSGGQENSSR